MGKRTPHPCGSMICSRDYPSSVACDLWYARHATTRCERCSRLTWGDCWCASNLDKQPLKGGQ